MGGRGASSGVSNKGKKYGTEYKTLLKESNIKFVTKNSSNSEVLMETMTKGRVYATVNNKNELSSIIYFDNSNKRKKQIDLLKKHRELKPHTHHGYLHNEKDSPKGASKLTDKEIKMVAKINKLWYNKYSK